MNGDIGKEIRNEAESRVEYVPESLELKDPALEAFSNVFARFQLPSETTTVRTNTSFGMSGSHVFRCVGAGRRANKRRGHLFRRRHGV